MEFYRVATSLLSDREVPSADVGAIFEGQLDLYISRLKWGIKLLLEGKDASGHEFEGRDDWQMRDRMSICYNRLSQ